MFWCTGYFLQLKRPKAKTQVICQSPVNVLGLLCSHVAIFDANCYRKSRFGWSCGDFELHHAVNYSHGCSRMLRVYEEQMDKGIDSLTLWHIATPAGNLVGGPCPTSRKMIKLVSLKKQRGGWTDRKLGRPEDSRTQCGLVVRTDGLWGIWDVCTTRLWNGRCPGCVDMKYEICHEYVFRELFKFSWVQWDYIYIYCMHYMHTLMRVHIAN